MRQAFINARIVFPDQVLENETLVVEDGFIQAIAPETLSDVSVIDLNGAYLLPGLIDLHCDAIEGVIEPRSGVHFPIDFGVCQMDRINAMAGITTSFNSISFADEEFGVRGIEMAAEIVEGVKARAGHTLVDNRVHVRYEITEPLILPKILAMIENNLIDLISFMDHTPGQGQFKETIDYINYQRKNYGTSHEKIDWLLKNKHENKATAAERMTLICQAAKNKGLPLISHDDDAPERVRELKELGITVSEFPINLATAIEARRNDLTTVFGAPNTLRGKSQSGSMKAIEAIENQVADCLCSDYFPSTLIPAVFMLPEKLGLPLNQAVNLVTSNPAKAVGLKDRGEISFGKVADLVCVDKIKGQFQVTAVWSKGQRVFAADYHLGRP